MGNKKTVDDLIKPLFSIAKSVDNLKDKLGSTDEQTSAIISKMEKALLEMLQIVQELKKYGSK